MSISHICKYLKCGMRKMYGYRPTCRTETCEDYRKEIFDECIYQH